MRDFYLISSYMLYIWPSNHKSPTSHAISCNHIFGKGHIYEIFKLEKFSTQIIIPSEPAYKRFGRTNSAWLFAELQSWTILLHFFLLFVCK